MSAVEQVCSWLAGESVVVLPERRAEIKSIAVGLVLLLALTTLGMFLLVDAVLIIRRGLRRRP